MEDNYAKNSKLQLADFSRFVLLMYCTLHSIFVSPKKLQKKQALLHNCKSSFVIKHDKSATV